MYISYNTEAWTHSIPPTVLIQLSQTQDSFDSMSDGLLACVNSGSDSHDHTPQSHSYQPHAQQRRAPRTAQLDSPSGNPGRTTPPSPHHWTKPHNALPTHAPQHPAPPGHSSQASHHNSPSRSPLPSRTPTHYLAPAKTPRNRSTFRPQPMSRILQLTKPTRARSRSIRITPDGAERQVHSGFRVVHANPVDLECDRRTHGRQRHPLRHSAPITTRYIDGQIRELQPGIFSPDQRGHVYLLGNQPTYPCQGMSAATVSPIQFVWAARPH